MRGPSQSIRDILLLIIGALTLMVALLAAGEIVGEWQRLTRLKALREASALSNMLFDATERLSIERDIVVSMLNARDAATAAGLRPRLNGDRRAADAALTAGMAGMERYNFPELSALRARIISRLKVIDGLRQEVDRAAARPDDGHHAELSARWSREVTALLTQTQTLWIGFVGHFTDIDPVVTQHLWYKHFLRTITDYAGRERSLIGRLIVENTDPTPRDQAMLLRGQAIADQGWRMTRILADQSGLYPFIAPAYRDARSQYATMHDMLKDMFYVPGGRHGAVYPIGIDLWFELSTQASDTLGALRAASIVQTQRYIDRLIERSERQMALQAALFVIAFLLCALSFRVIVLRVVRPINTMIDALVRTGGGEKVELVLPQHRDDEITKLAGVLNVVRQALEQVRLSAAELDRSESHLRAVVDHAVDGLIIFDAAGSVESFNHAAERLFGYSAEEAAGWNLKILMPELDPGELEEYLTRTLAGGDGRLMGASGWETSARRKDGSIFPIDLSISAFASGGGRYFSAILRDITARKEAEQALLRHTGALERSNKELDDFAYIASHDLKEPLRGIHNHARFLLEDNEGRLDAESAGRLERLVFLSQRMERLVNDLLYFSRLGRQELAVQPTDLGAAVADIESTLEHFLQERGASIVTAARLPTIVCDRPRVIELLRNLITNAVKYNDKPQKIIEVGMLDSHARPGGTMARRVLFVRDNGLGIAPEFHEDIFRIFKRLQASKGKEEGTGVGLTFVKKIVERHGGEIWLESEPGKGTTFYFTLEAQSHEPGIESKAAA